MKYLIIMLSLSACYPSMKTVESTSIPVTTVPFSPQYIGCYTDTSSRALPTQLSLVAVTVETCIVAGRLAGYKYIGLQYSNQCWAGNMIGFYKDAETACNISCNANYAEWCGGNYHNSIWQVLP